MKLNTIYVVLQLIMENPNQIFELSLLPLMGKTMKIVDCLIADLLEEKGIEATKVQLVLLKILHDQDGQPQNSLAFLTDRDKASLTRLLTTMEKKGLVARLPSKTDKRINLVYTTKKGQMVYRSAIPILKQVIDQMEHGLTPVELEAMRSGITKMRTNLIKDKKAL